MVRGVGGEDADRKMKLGWFETAGRALPAPA
jgi:hypothetical protein